MRLRRFVVMKEKGTKNAEEKGGSGKTRQSAYYISEGKRDHLEWKELYHLFEF